jgi:ATP-dependent 26S proteasome regulatory subunit
MITAEQFISEKRQQGKPKVLLAQYENDIAKLRASGLTIHDILEFLQINGVVVSYTTLQKFLVQLQRKPLANPATKIKEPKHEPKAKQNLIDSAEKQEQGAVNLLEGSSNKFDWQTPINAEDWM